jgi:MFS transporter, SP family, general alpha glucoside:H+ symporter
MGTLDRHDDDKYHPSELLEFATIPGQNVAFDLERSEHDSRPPPNLAVDSTPNTGLYRNLAASDNGQMIFSRNALAAAQSEHAMTLRQGLYLYPKAIAWSAAISLAIIMEGYDTALVSTFYAFKEFQRSYGVPVGDGQYQISPRWQSSLSNGATAGSIVGLFVSGIVTQRIGYRHTMLGAMLLLTIFIFPSFFAYNIQTLLASQILCGLPWGILSTLTTTYAAEVVPLNLRVYLTSIVNLCWLLGQICSQVVLRALLDWKSEWAYRVPFGLQWVWIGVVCTVIVFAPESPWWLIQQNRTEEAERVLKRLRRRNRNFDPANTIAIMEHTDTVEKYFNAASMKDKDSSNHTLYLECFRGTNLRRTEIACMIFVSQNLCGLPIIGYAAYLFCQIGFSEHRSFDITIGMQSIAIFGSLIALVLMKYFGRRPLYLSGLILSCLLLSIAGAIGSLHETPLTVWAVASLLIVFIFVFDATVGPITYCLVAEIPSTRLRVKTVVLARVAYYISGIVTTALIQRMLNPTAWNWRGKACFFCAGTCGLSLIYCYFRLPETRGLGFHELDVLFENRAGGRKFAGLQKVLERNGYYSFDETPGTGAG